MNEQLLALINKLISKLESIAPSLADSEAVLLATKALQELTHTQAHDNALTTITQAVSELESLIYSIDSGLKALIDANGVDISALTANVGSHLSDFSNPHNVTKEQVGLANVDNYATSDSADDDSVNKFSTAKAVNTVWNKAKLAVEEAPVDNKNYIRKDKSWVDIQTQYKFDSVPIGTIMAFYGKVAPDGYLLCDGRAISNSDYPELVAHISNLQQAKYKTTSPIVYDGGSWERGLMESDNIKAISWVNTEDNKLLNNLFLLKKYITPTENSELVAIIDEYVDYGSMDNETGIRYSIANARYRVNVIHGDWEDFKKEASGKSIDIYNNISDIPLRNSVYLPDLRNQFLRGYDSRASRELMSNESVTIRNISGSFGADRNYAATIYSKNNMSSLFNLKESDPETPYLNKTTLGSPGVGWRQTIYFDASKVVPTSSENRPTNVNPLFIIKAN